MEFAILGPVEARVDGAALPLGGPKQRALLAILLLNANEPVSRDRLIAGLWGDRPPPSAAQSLDSYVSRLRRVLGTDRIVRRAARLPRRRRAGRTRPRALRARWSRGGRCTRRSTCGAGRRSPTCSTSRSPARRPSGWRSGGCVALEDARSTPTSSPARARELVPELDALVHEHPFRERLHRPADARALPRRPPGRRARRHARGAAPARRRAGDGAGSAAARARAADPRPGPAARRARRRRRGRRPPFAPARDWRWLGARGSPSSPAPPRCSWPAATRSGAPASARVDRAVAIDAGERAAGPPPSSSPAPPTAAVAAAGSLWLADPEDQLVLRLDPDSGQIEDRIAMPGQPGASPPRGGAVWVAGPLSGSVTRIDPASGRVTQTVRGRQRQPRRDRLARRRGARRRLGQPRAGRRSTRAPAPSSAGTLARAAPDRARRRRRRRLGRLLRRRRGRADRPGVGADAADRARRERAVARWRRRAARCGWPTRSTRRSRASTR